VPNDYTVEQVSELYRMMYDLGCKGGTIYRDGSRDEQVLMLKGDERAESEMEKQQQRQVEAKKGEQVATPHRVYPRPNKLSGVTVKRQTAFGKVYITMNSDENDCPFEVFITIGKAGSDIQADADGLGRMLSLLLRSTGPQNRMDMLKNIIDQLEGIGGSRSVGFGNGRVLSMPDAVAGALREHYLSEEVPEQLDLPMVEPDESSLPVSSGVISGADICPECGTVSLIRTEGCRKCMVCGFAEC
jgi:ribonucleoside-diphosphate reductase alpha chain